MNLNKAQIIGRITQDIVLKQTKTGMSVASTSVATNRVWTDKAGAKQQEVEFHNVVFWGKLAEIVTQFCKKGSLIYVEGRIKTREWTAKDGAKRKTVEIVADSIQLGPRPAGEAKPTTLEEEKKADDELPEINIDEEGIKAEDLPFN